MPLRSFRTPWIFEDVATHVAATPYTFVRSQGVLVNKTVGAATSVVLPSTPGLWDTRFVKDLKGDAAANNITITDPGGANIDGSASYVISTNYGSVILQWNGTTWSVLAVSP